MSEALAVLADLATQFEGLLADEERALRGQDATLVELLAADKGRLVAAIEQRLLHLARPPAGSDATEARQRLHERFLACQHQNRLNGALIEANRSFNTLLLDALRGRTGARAQVYGRRGGLTELRDTASLGRA
jgi:flagellar biosynthesis/type III secretory pathway chaperone